MKALKALTAGLALVFALALTVRAADKEAPKEAAKEVTLKGEMVCPKCTLSETKACQNVLKVTEAGKETKYYLVKYAKKDHGPICPAGSSKEASVTGSVEEKEGKKTVTVSKIEYAK